ncbi:hypothetical protein KEM48_013394 [Puccinia striiformis f. sp. tritici PST-130]|nr:hypothetical protein H4Q26_014414 [Puccinia striiformis f. sp. tritici PST-130]KAI9631030.1 hypothetical protein KEM48_013394 [Puccinia striiformis f. sp. tritici PST-130]
MVTPMLEGLIELFYETIVELDLGFINYLSLPTSTIKAIRRITNLQILRLGFDSQPESGESPDDDRTIIHHHGLDCFCSMLDAAPRLKCLDIGGIHSSDLPEISESDLDHIQLENITHLVIESSAPVHRIINIAIRLKSSLAMLSISSHSWDDYRDLLPIFEPLEDQLEGLSTESAKVLNPIAHLKFAALRLLRITHCDGWLSDFLQLDMLSYASIEVLVLGGYYLVEQKADNPACLVDTFAKFPALRRLVFDRVESGLTAPEIYLRACQEQQVEILYRAHQDLPELMTRNARVPLMVKLSLPGGCHRSQHQLSIIWADHRREENAQKRKHHDSGPLPPSHT